MHEQQFNSKYFDWLAVEYCGNVMFYYFLLADNSGCYTIFVVSNH